MATISCSSAETVPNECHRMGARSGKVSRRLESSSSAVSLWSGLVSSSTSKKIFSASSAAAAAAIGAMLEDSAGRPGMTDMPSANSGWRWKSLTVATSRARRSGFVQLFVLAHLTSHRARRPTRHLKQSGAVEVSGSQWNLTQLSTCNPFIKFH